MPRVYSTHVACRYAVEDVWGTWSARVYFFLLILCGSWFVINLALAVISDAFTSATVEERATQERERRHKEALVAGARENFLENGGKLPAILQTKKSAPKLLVDAVTTKWAALNSSKDARVHPEDPSLMRENSLVSPRNRNAKTDPEVAAAMQANLLASFAESFLLM
jgi:hypothetical protein